MLAFSDVFYFFQLHVLSFDDKFNEWIVNFSQCTRWCYQYYICLWKLITFVICIAPPYSASILFMFASTALVVHNNVCHCPALRCVFWPHHVSYLSNCWAFQLLHLVLLSCFCWYCSTTCCACQRSVCYSTMYPLLVHCMFVLHL